MIIKKNNLQDKMIKSSSPSTLNNVGLLKERAVWCLATSPKGMPIVKGKID